MVLAGCGSSKIATQTQTTTRTQTVAATTTTAAAPPAWQPDSPEPDLTTAQWQQLGTSVDRAWIGDADERLGALANTHGSAGQREGRCIAEQIRIHDATREYALLLAFKQHDAAAERAVGNAVGTCVGLETTHDPRFEQSLAKNP